MKKRTDDEKQEYTRVNNELISRLNACYNDGAMLASFILIYYATLIAGLVQCFSITDKNLVILIFGFTTSITLFFPVVILHAFGVKFKENFIGLCNISNFTLIYHEYPTLLENRLKGFKWELLHKNTLSQSTKHESKEYFLLALTSFMLFLVSILIEIYLIASTGVHNIPFLNIICITVVYLIFTIISVIYLRKIYCVTDLKRLWQIVESLKIFYESQVNDLSKIPTGEKLMAKIEELKQKENELNIFLEKRKIPDYEAIEVIRLFYTNKYDENDKYIKLLKKEAKSKNIVNLKELLFTSTQA